MRVVDVALMVVPAALRVVVWFAFAVGVAVLVGLLVHTATATGPNCPPPVPYDWLGYCADYKPN